MISIVFSKKIRELNNISDMHLNVIEGNKRLIRIAYYNRVTLKIESETIIE